MRNKLAECVDKLLQVIETFFLGIEAKIDLHCGLFYKYGTVLVKKLFATGVFI